MKTKILNALKTKYANLGLGDKAFDGVASFLAKTITEEKDIATTIEGEDVKALLKGFQGDSDVIRAARLKAEKDLEEYKKAHPEQTTTTTTTTTEGEDSEVMKLLKEMKASNEALKARLDESDNKAKRAVLIEGVRTALKKDNRNVDALINIVLSNPEIGESDTVETLTEKYKGVYDTQYKALYGDGAVPPAGGFFANVQQDDPNEFAGAVGRLRESGVLKQETKTE